MWFLIGTFFFFFFFFFPFTHVMGFDRHPSCTCKPHLNTFDWEGCWRVETKTTVCVCVHWAWKPEGSMERREERGKNERKKLTNLYTSCVSPFLSFASFFFLAIFPSLKEFIEEGGVRGQRGKHVSSSSSYCLFPSSPNRYTHFQHHLGAAVV